MCIPSKCLMGLSCFLTSNQLPSFSTKISGCFATPALSVSNWESNSSSLHSLSITLEHVLLVLVVSSSQSQILRFSIQCHTYLHVALGSSALHLCDVESASAGLQTPPPPSWSGGSSPEALHWLLFTMFRPSSLWAQ